MRPSRKRLSASVDDRNETGLHAGVLPHPDEHGRAALGRDLIVEQTLHAEVDETGDVVILEESIEVGIVGSDVAIGGGDQDLKVLFDQRIFFHGETGFELAFGFTKVGLKFGAAIRCEYTDLAIESFDAAGGCIFGTVAGVDVDQELRVEIAFGDPGRRTLREGCGGDE